MITQSDTSNQEGLAVEIPRPKILIVDDRPANLLALERVLTGCGAELVRAESGDTALKATLHHEFALAILDVQMPGMDGYELAEYLRGAAKTRSLPIIFLTAVHSDEHHVFRGYEAGAVDFLTKPYEPRILTAKVQIFLELDRRRRALEHALETERARRWLEHILLQLSDALLVVGVSGRVQTVNASLLELLGHPEQAPVDRPLQEVLRTARDSTVAQRFVTALEVGDLSALRVTNLELSLVRSDGEARPVLLSAAPLTDADGALAGAVIVLKDISEIDRARDALRRSEAKYRRLFDSTRDGLALVRTDGTILDKNAAFDGLIVETQTQAPRSLFEHLALPTPPPIDDTDTLITAIESQDTLLMDDGTRKPVKITVWPCDEAPVEAPALWLSVHDMSDERRRERERIMTEKMTTLGTLVGGVAHELNNPLMGITNYVEFCLKRMGKASGPDHACQKVLGDAQRETKRCIDLVQNLLLVARSGQGTTEERTEVDVDELIDRVIRLLNYRIGKERVSVERDFPEQGLRLETRAQGLQQVLLNLIVNALDAMGDSETRILRLAGSRQGDDVQGIAQITVDDTGSGIPESVRASIFDAFYTTKPPGKGTGLGLSVSKRIVEELGGALRCESAVGEGTRFTIDLPG